MCKQIPGRGDAPKAITGKEGRKESSKEGRNETRKTKNERRKKGRKKEGTR